MRHDKPKAFNRQCSSSLRDAASQIPSQNIQVFPRRNDKVRGSQNVPASSNYRGELVQEIRRRRGEGDSRRQARAQAWRRKAQTLRRTDGSAQENRNRQDARSVDEYLNRDVKANLAERKRPTSAKMLCEKVSSRLVAKQADPESIRRLFQKEEERYAAE